MMNSDGTCSNTWMKWSSKPLENFGGDGMLIGPHSTAEQREEFRQRSLADHANYIAQETLAFSRAPCFLNEQIGARHVDLRPFVLYGDHVTVVPGGLTE